MMTVCNRAKAQPQVCGVSNARHRAFIKLQEARQYMNENGVRDGDYDEEIGFESEPSTVRGGHGKYYAVANGALPGIYLSYSLVDLRKNLLDLHTDRM